MTQTSRRRARAPRAIDTLVIGGGQAGLSVSYHLTRHGRPQDSASAISM